MTWIRVTDAYGRPGYRWSGYKWNPKVKHHAKPKQGEGEPEGARDRRGPKKPRV